MSLTLSIWKTCCRFSTKTNFIYNNYNVLKFSTFVIPPTLRQNPHQYYVTELKFSTYAPLHQNIKNPKGATDDLKNQPEWQKTPMLEAGKLPQYCLMLSKIRLTSLVVLTSMAGYALAPAPFDPTTFVLCSIGTGLVSCAANSINQFFEVPFDAQMNRTKNRVLVRGLISPIHAASFAFVTAASGIVILNVGVNTLTALLGLSNLILYTCIYTPMKRISIYNTWVGSVVGAIPPLMGWVACEGSFGDGAIVLAALLYSWQFPHFNALSWNLRPDYSRAGYRMMAVTDPALCRNVAFRHTGIITAVSCAAPYFDVTNNWFAIESLPLNLYFMYLAWNFRQKSDSKSSRKLFRFSLIHLPALMVLFLINKKRWVNSNDLGESKTLYTESWLTDNKFIRGLSRGTVVNAYRE